MVSLAPSAQSESVGIEGPLLIETCRFQYFDYPEKDGVSAIGFGMMMRGLTLEGDDRAQFYSVGDKDLWEPIEDGCKLNNKSDSERAPKKSCTFSQFVRELDNAGYETEEHLSDGDVSVLDGAIVDFQASEAPSFEGGSSTRPKPMPAKLLAAPGEKNEWRTKFNSAGSGNSTETAGSRRSKGASKKSSKKSAAAGAGGSRRRSKKGADAGDGDTTAIDELTHKYMLQLLEDYEEIPREGENTGDPDLASLILKQAKSESGSIRKAIVARVYEESFLTSYPDDWEFADDTVYGLEEAEEE